MLHRWLTTLDYYRLAYARVRRLRPALLHCNDYNTMWVGCLAKWTAGTRVVFDWHELWPDRNGRREPRWWLMACEWLFLRVADRAITTSPGYAEAMARRYGVPAPAVIRNLPSHTPRQVGAGSAGEAECVYVGGLMRGRGLEQAIDALPHLPGVRLRLVGPAAPGYAAHLAARARSAGVDERVEMVGAVPPEQVTAEIRGASIGLCLIQPICRSYELTLPNKLFEYAVAGVPVLASDLPVIARTVRGLGMGEVARPGDAAAVAAAARRLLDPARQSAVRARLAELGPKLTWAAEAPRLHEVYAATATDAAAAPVA